MKEVLGVEKDYPTRIPDLPQIFDDLSTDLPLLTVSEGLRRGLRLGKQLGSNKNWEIQPKDNKDHKDNTIDM